MHCSLTTAAISLLLACPVALADETVSIKPAADNTIFTPSGEDQLSSGAGADLYAGATLRFVSLRRALVRFDLGVLPARARVTNVELRLTQTRTTGGPGPASVHRVLSDWGEGASVSPSGAGALSSAGDASWNFAFYPETEWATPGGDFAPASAVSTLPGSGPTTLCTWSSAAMLADVRGWIGDPASNHGWMLIGDEATTGSARKFASRESATVSQRPALVVTFVRPCSPADVASLGGVIGADGAQTVDDLVAFLQAFFAGDTSVADLATLGGASTPDGQLTPDDLLLFLSYFFGPCLS
jgi:hypothetical protein